MPLAAWESFYVIIGSSAAALTGLQFVVIVLAAESNGLGRGQATNAFATPTVVHFCVALFISAIVTAPWASLSSPGFCLIACSLFGLAYGMMVVRRARMQTEYVPVAEDWIWHSVLPLIAYASLLVSSITLLRYPPPSLFAIGGVAMLLLFVGIHNAWDAVTYIAHRQNPDRRADQN
jgi:hypothetical protein